MTTVIRQDPECPEWRNVFVDENLIGCFGRTEECGIIRWVAFDTQNRRLAEFGGRGAAIKAQRAVMAAFHTGNALRVGSPTYH